MFTFLAHPGLTRLALTWSLFMIDLTVKGSIVLITAFLISKTRAKAPFQFHHLVIFLGLCSFAVLPAIYQLDWVLFLHRSLGQGLHYTQSAPSFNPGTADRLLYNLALFGPWLMLIWFAGFSRQVAGIIRSMMEVGHIRRNSLKLEDTSWNQLLQSMRIAGKISRKIEIRETAQYPAPITCGFLNSLIILPREARGWAEEQQQVVLLHELSHIRRYDNLLQFFALSIAAVFWFNPLVWRAIRILLLNREGACDDYVLNAGFKPSAYAGHLLGIVHACRNNSGGLTSHGKAPMVAKERLLNILDTSRITRMLSPKTIILSVLMGIIFILPFAAINPVAATERMPQLSGPMQYRSSHSPVYHDPPSSTITHAGRAKTPLIKSSPHPTRAN